MARILISHQSPISHEYTYQAPAFYEGFINSLRENGNDIFHLITNDILISPWNGSNKPYSQRVKKDIHEKIKLFNPDMVISFNNSSIEGIETLVDCPILLWDADSAAYFNSPDTIRQNPNRYHFLAVSDHSISDFVQYLGIPRQNIFKMRFATAVKAKNLDRIYNISFIGTNFRIHRNLQSLLANDLVAGQKLIEYSKYKSIVEIQDYIDKSELAQRGIQATQVKDIRAGQDRIQTLSAIAPLGLQLFGDERWGEIYQYSIESYQSYDPSLVYNLEQNEAIYNRSKIGISISHAQNVTAYPWRVSDIMASNAALVSDKKSDLVQDFGSSVPLQLYENPQEAYEITKRLLSEDNLRDDVVQASHEAIESGYRWHHRLKDIQDITGIQLLAPSTTGTYERYSPPEDIVGQVVETLLTMKRRDRNKQSLLNFIAHQLKRSASYITPSFIRKLIRARPSDWIPSILKFHIYRVHGLMRSKRTIYKI